MAESLVLFLLAALPLLGSPGPATLSIAATGSFVGVVRGAPYCGGVVLGTSFVVFLVATGVTGLMFTIPGVLPVLTIAAFCYILFFSVQNCDGADRGRGRGFGDRAIFSGRFAAGHCESKSLRRNWRGVHQRCGFSGAAHDRREHKIGGAGGARVLRQHRMAGSGRRVVPAVATSAFGAAGQYRVCGFAAGFCRAGGAGLSVACGC
jgi:hypothetical protein